MTPIYKWQIEINGMSYDAYPVYGDNMALEYTMENSEKFFRGELSENMTFVGDDMERIMNTSFEQRFNLTLFISTDGGGTWSEYYKCMFYKTDCTINLDDKTITVKPSVNDRYIAVLNGMDKEYDLIKLAPVIQPLNAQKKPMFQFWTVGENIITSVSGGMSFETDTIDESEERASYCHFNNFETFTEITFSADIDGLREPFTGDLIEGQETVLYNTEGIFQLWYHQVLSAWIMDVQYINGETIRWKAAMDGASVPSTITFEAQWDGDPNITAEKYSIKVYGRLVTDKSSLMISGVQTDIYPIGTDDMVAYNRNYNYCVGIGADFSLQFSKRTSVTPTEWGRLDNGEYFLPPDSSGNWYPIGRSQWINTSLWLKYDTGYYNWEVEATKDYVIKDTFPIWSVISVLLQQIAPSVTHQGTAAYSKWLYDGGTQLINEMLFIAPKSNIIAGEYQVPAQKAPVTLKEVLEMLEKVMGCYWFIDDSNRFRIEHISYFKNGGSYSSTPSVGYDLTNMEQLTNGKMWSFMTSEYSYDKEAMPARYEYSWMDDCSKVFEGQPIDVLSSFVQEDKVEDISISNFTSDLDYMLLAPENCSKDGFALLMASENYQGTEYTVDKLMTTIDGYNYRLQNYKLSMWFLQQYFLTYDMPSWSIKVNGASRTADGIQRNKKQEVSIPMNDDTMDLMKLVRTGIGDGEFEKVSINLSSRMAKVTLKYNTYDAE